MKSWHKVLLGMILGLCFGLIAGEQLSAVAFIGKAFIDLLKMIVGFVVFVSLVTGICQLSSPGQLGRIGGKTLGFFFVATLLSIGAALLVNLLIQPGTSLHLEALQSDAKALVTPWDLISGLIPANPVAAFANGEILQIIFFGFLFAYALLITGEKGRSVVAFFESLSAVLQTLTAMIMKLAPIGVFAIMASAVGALGIHVVFPMMGYVLCNWLGCLLLMGIFYPIVISWVCKLSVRWFYSQSKEVMLFAMSTCSSSASLPASIQCATERLGVSGTIARFVLSLGITLNMNGSVICQISAAFFVANAYGIDLSWMQMAIICLTSILASIGVAGVPGSAMVMLSMVLGSVGLPLEGIGLVFAVDRLRDMGSTLCNITGDLLATVFIGKMEKKTELLQSNAVNN